MKALRTAGMTVHITSALGGGFPDLVVGWRGINVLLEVKDGAKFPSQQALTLDEQKFFDSWGGQRCVVLSAEHAVDAVLEQAVACGVAV